MWESDLKKEIKEALEKKPATEVWEEVINKVMVAFEEASHEVSEKQLKNII